MERNERHKARLARLQELRCQSSKQEQASYYNLLSDVTECSEIKNDGKPTRRSHVYSPDILNELYVQQGELCPLCSLHIPYGRWQVDHKIPVAYGGGNEISNLQLVHSDCNQEKKDKAHPADLLRYLESKE
ncbi:HNH endonuclease [Vibrio parahaemolyticus]|nr:HNH endonuclease [Vibrio parahaemolyticus]ELA7280694.1 HNH endonuclease [Vibrio parahaemolyticus]ELA7343312.1 HNH endonuclease [Vibrio parahaemolyticus]